MKPLGESLALVKHHPQAGKWIDARKFSGAPIFPMQ
jgi:hypothetical protein